MPPLQEIAGHIKGLWSPPSSPYKAGYFFGVVGIGGGYPSIPHGINIYRLDLHPDPGICVGLRFRGWKFPVALWWPSS